MPIVVTPEVGIPLPFDTTPDEIEDFRAKATAMFNTVQELIKHGAEVVIDDADRRAAHTAFAESRISKEVYLKPGAVVALEALLTEWDHEILDVSRKLRNYVTNRLIAESNDIDPKHRLKALVSLGKLSNVGLFNERIEVNINQRPITDIESELAKTLAMFSNKENAEDVELLPPPTVAKTLQDFDIDKELGLSE